MKKLVSSKFLNTVKLNDGYAVYHSLRGGLCIIDESLKKLFYLFNEPNTIDDVIKKHPTYNRDDIEQFIKLFGNRGFIIEEDYDEYAAYNKLLEEHRIKLKTGNQVKIIQLVVTNNCNFRCKYCFTNSIYSSNERKELQQAKYNKVMLPEDAIEYVNIVVDRLKSLGENRLHIQFFGGEPLANWKTVQSIFDYFEDGSKHDMYITYGIVTNGSLITEEIANYFKKYNSPVVLSFDSPKGDNRVLVDGSQAFEKITEGFNVLKNNGNTVIFNSVFSKETFKSFDLELIDYAYQNNVKEIGVLFDLDLDFYKLYSADEIVDKLWEVYTYGQQKGILVTGYWHMIFQQVVSYDKVIHLGYKTCSATGCQLSIEPSGDVFACKASSGYFGNIRNLDELFNNDKYIKYASRYLRNSVECKNCEIEHFCSGVCLGPLEKKYQAIDAVEKHACDVFKKITRRLIENLDQEAVDSYAIKN